MLTSMRVIRLARLGVLMLGMAVAAAGALASDKRGVGIADRGASDRVQKVGASWYYTWTPLGMTGRLDGVEFVPMVWGGRWLKTQMLQMQSMGKVPVLLAFNEPERVDQANMSVYEAVSAWPDMARLAARIGSPAVAGGQGAWADAFDKQAKAKGLKVDFMAVHLYGPPDTKRFLQRLDAVHERYGKPIWLTEFAVADWEAKQPGSNRYSEQEVIRFMREVIPELERRSYVERYAWFGAGKGGSEAVRTSRLFDNKGELTALGRAYASF